MIYNYLHELSWLEVLHLPSFGLCQVNLLVLGIPINDALDACLVVHVGDLLLG
jgi:hypothetical protein